MLTLADDIADQQFDYIICGGGTAGLTVAARLTEDPNVNVLVLEAGEANLNDPAILRPASYGSHFGHLSYDWAHKTVPQEHCNNNEFLWQRGKGLGGSSAINFLCWTKPPASDIDDFERLGNPGWNWKRYQHYAHKAENFTHPDEQIQTQNKMRLWSWGKTGTEGPLLTSFPGKIIAAEMDVQQTLINLGIPVAADPLNGDTKGCSFNPNTVNPLTQTRTYAASAYYLPNADRPNFHVAVSVLVTRVVLEKTASGGFEATGVEVLSASRKFVIKAKKEVIISTGGLKSSQLLELSGIGNRTILERYNIPVHIDLPSVGENVQEHMFGGVTWELKDSVSFETLDILRDPKVAAEHIELHKKAEGAFTIGITGFAFMPLEALSPRGKEIHDAVREKIMKNADSYPPGLLEQYKIQLRRIEEQAPASELISIPGFMSYPNPPKPNRKYISMFFALNHNFSRGTIHITSNSAQTDPAYDPRYFSEECDLQTFVEMGKYTRKLANAEPFKTMLVEEVNPGPDVTTDEQLTDWIKKTMSTTYHTAGACSMLPRDKGGVVDPNLKVYGTTNLRVVDLSIVPLHFASHPVASVYSIAEQAADIIKGKI